MHYVPKVTIYNLLKWNTRMHLPVKTGSIDAYRCKKPDSMTALHSTAKQNWTYRMKYERPPFRRPNRASSTWRCHGRHRLRMHHSQLPGVCSLAPATYAILAENDSETRSERLFFLPLLSAFWVVPVQNGSVVYFVEIVIICFHIATHAPNWIS